LGPRSTVDFVTGGGGITVLSLGASKCSQLDSWLNCGAMLSDLLVVVFESPSPPVDITMSIHMFNLFSVDFVPFFLLLGFRGVVRIAIVASDRIRIVRQRLEISGGISIG
jgi:hypothetical protein